MNKKILLTLLFIPFIAGCIGQPGSTFYYYDYNQIPPDPQAIDSSWNVQISFSDNNLCVGDTVTGTINTNINNGRCNIFIDTGTGPVFDSTITLDNNGDYFESRTMNAVGVANIFAVCTNSEMMLFARSSIETITTQMCADDNYYCCLAMGVQSCYYSGCPPAGQRVQIYDTEAECIANCIPIEEPEGSCSDTDNGDFIFTYGVCTDASGPTADVCPNGDFSDYISEAYCGSTDCMGYSTSCYAQLASCYKGECIRWDQDSDGDSYPDLEELDMGTDPNDANDYPYQETDACEDFCSSYGFINWFYEDNMDIVRCGTMSADDCSPVSAGFYNNDDCCCWSCESVKSCDEWVIEIKGPAYDGFCGDSSCVDWQGTPGAYLGNAEADAFCGAKCCYYVSACEAFAISQGFVKFAEQPYCESLAIADCSGGYTMQNYPSMNCCMWRCT